MAAPPPFSREFPAAATGDAPNPLIAATPNLLATTRAAKPQWRCEICNVSVGIANKDAHLAGKRHARQEQLQPWSCTICDRSMTPDNKASHLGGRSHAAAVRACAQQKPAAAATGDAPNPSIAATPNLLAATGAAKPQWQCEICDVSVERAKKDEHLAGRPHARQKRQPWDCTICDRSMTLAVKASHLAGKAHAAAARKGGNSRRRRRRRDDDYDDYEEGRQLLMDIDTQWGLIPGGGAYNDL
jgi:rubrerythrin